jgi:hypothetical protein
LRQAVSWFDLPGLHLDQALLIAGEGFEFGHQGTIRLQAPQVREPRSTVFGEQIRIDLIGFGAGFAPLAIHRLGVDRIDRGACRQQGSNQQAMGHFHYAGQLRFPLRPRDGGQEIGEFGEAARGMRHPTRAHLTSFSIDDDHIVVVVSPIDASKPHEQNPPCYERPVPGQARPFDSGAQSAILSSSLGQEHGKAKNDLSKPVEPCGGGGLSPSAFDR